MNLSVLSEVEKSELVATRKQWAEARASGLFKDADALRGALSEYGCLPPDYTKWHPVFESAAHRQARLERRNKDK